MAGAAGGGGMKRLEFDEDAARQTIAALQGPFVAVPLELIQRLECDLEAAVFVSFTVFLSSCCKKQEGWFFLEQEKKPDPESGSMFSRLGSWQHAVGIKKGAQLSLRKRLEKLGLLFELPSAREVERKRKKNEQADQEPLSLPQNAFIFEQTRGAPPRLHYKVDFLKYLAWLGGKHDK